MALLTKFTTKLLKAVTEQIESLKFNTAIAQLMVFVNTANKGRQTLCRLRQRLYPIDCTICPHLAEELWQTVAATGGGQSLMWLGQLGTEVRWLKKKSKLSSKSKVKSVPNSWSLKTYHEKVYRNCSGLTKKSKQKLTGKEIVRNSAVPNKLVNIVVK